MEMSSSTITTSNNSIIDAATALALLAQYTPTSSSTTIQRNSQCWRMRRSNRRFDVPVFRKEDSCPEGSMLHPNSPLTTAVLSDPMGLFPAAAALAPRWEYTFSERLMEMLREF